MRLTLILLIFYGCSHGSNRPGKDTIWRPEVSVNAALNQAQMSYLLGCVRAFKELKLAPAFPTCRDLALEHRNEIEGIMRSEIQ